MASPSQERQGSRSLVASAELPWAQHVARRSFQLAGSRPGGPEMRYVAFTFIEGRSASQTNAPIRNELSDNRPTRVHIS